MENLELIKPFFRKKLYLSMKPYYLERTEKEGEQDLYSIAKSAIREHNWVFFPETETWVSNTSGYEINDDGLSVRFSLLNETPFGEEQIYYHFHPDRQPYKNITDYESKKELIKIINALPSERDYICAAEKMEGHEMRVLSSIGVFSLKGHANPIIPNYNDYIDVITNCFNTKTLKKNGMIPTIHELVENMNIVSDNYVSLDFRPRI